MGGHEFTDIIKHFLIDLAFVFFLFTLLSVMHVCQDPDVAVAIYFSQNVRDVNHVQLAFTHITKRLARNNVIGRGVTFHEAGFRQTERAPYGLRHSL